MAKQKLRFVTLNMYVTNPQKTIELYESLGFSIINTSLERKGLVDMKLSKESDFMITIMEANMDEKFKGSASIGISNTAKMELEEPIEIDVISQSFINYDL
jgi:hypothetical protein